MDNELLKLKTSLNDAINKWVEEQSGNEQWEALGTLLGDFVTELMTDSAFNILLAQKDLNDYLDKEDLLK